MNNENNVLEEIYKFYHGDLEEFKIINSEKQKGNIREMYVTPDIEGNCKVPIKGQYPSGLLTIPITLATFSIIDLIGYLKRTDGNPRQTCENIKAFFDKESTITQPEAIRLSQLYRNGMDHGFYPKRNLKVSSDIELCKSNYLFIKLSEGEALNVLYLIDIVDRIFVSVKGTFCNDTCMQSRYLEFIQEG